jgi:hypothetical protein
MLSVICLSLFIEQLSYKFYQASSLSFVNCNGTSVVATSKGNVTGENHHFHAHSKISLSLDKRYSITPPSSLPQAFFSIAAIYPTIRKVFFDGCGIPKNSTFFSVPGRAPPAA